MKMQVCDCTLLQYCNIPVLNCYRFFIEVNIVWMCSLFPDILVNVLQCPVRARWPSSHRSRRNWNRETPSEMISCCSLRWAIWNYRILLPVIHQRNVVLDHHDYVYSQPLLFLMEVLYLFRSSQCSTIGVTKAVVCVILSGMMHIKEPLLLIGKSSICSSSRFPHLPYNHK